MPNTDKLAEFTAWCQNHTTGDEKGQAQIFPDRIFQAFGYTSPNPRRIERNINSLAEAGEIFYRES